MSEFRVPVTVVSKVEKHPNADALSVCRVQDMDFRIVSGLDQFEEGEKVVYIPEGSIVPDSMLEEMGLTGRLAGSKKNRVKATKLRGIVSEGLIYTSQQVEQAQLGEDMAEALGIEKYVPEIPLGMEGEVESSNALIVKYDIENIKKYSDVLMQDELVCISEKLHGTLLQIGYHKGHGFIITSKGIGNRGLQFVINEKNKTSNLYVRLAFDTGLADKIKEYVEGGNYVSYTHVFAEIVGKGVQDLNYGLKSKEIRVFDVYQEGRFIDAGSCRHFCKEYLDVNTVPLLEYSVKWSEDLVEKHVTGNETLSGKEVHTREGIVIKPVKERRDPNLGRVILKAVSEDYLTRKGGTERN